MKTLVQLMSLANLELGCTEQMRYSLEIAAALDAWLVNPHTLRRRLLGTLFPLGGWLAYVALLIRRLLKRPTLARTSPSTN